MTTPAHANAAILAVGDELIFGQKTDTNSGWLSEQLAALGMRVIEHRTVGDDRAAIAAALKELAASVDLIVITGGLGPTDDDLVREGLGDIVAPGEPLQRDPVAVRRLKRWFAGRDKPMPTTNLKQAERPVGSRFLPNPHGTALGLEATVGGCRVFALPGPPSEMQPMFVDHVAPTVTGEGRRQVVVMRSVNVYGLGESEAAERLGDLMERGRNPLVGTTVTDGVLAVRLVAQGESKTIDSAVELTIADVEQRLAPYVFGYDEVTLGSSAGAVLGKAGATLASAESCTGGLLGDMIVQTPGSSVYYLGGWVTYSNELKHRCLGVGLGALEAHGAVSHETAAAMAAGALDKSGADFAIAITGIAGPDGGADDKPVGTVFIALARRENDGACDPSVRRFEFRGNRSQIRDRAAKSALQMLRFALTGVPATTSLLWERHGSTSDEHAD